MTAGPRGELVNEETGTNELIERRSECREHTAANVLTGSLST